jgi:hypothetical protein
MPVRRRTQNHTTPTSATPTAPLPPIAIAIDVEKLSTWAIGVARGVRTDYGFRIGSPEEEDLEGVAIVALVELMHRIDESRLSPESNLTEMFINWYEKEIRSRCRRHAVQLRNGGTFRTTSNPDVRRMRVEALPQTADGSDVALPWPEHEDEDEPEEYIECKYEPKLVILPPPSEDKRQGTKDKKQES